MVAAVLPGLALRCGAQGAVIGPIRIFIQVRDEAGNPLRGATRVRLEKGDGSRVEEFDTDPEGRMQFNSAPRGSLVVVAHREGYVPVRERLGLRQLQREIFLSLTLARSASLKESLRGPFEVSAAYLSIPPKARREYDKGIEKAQKGDYERAASHLEKATQLYAGSPLLWNDLGSVYFRSQKYDLAETPFRKALAGDQNYAPSLLNLGLLYNSGKRFAEAEAVLIRFTGLEGQRWQGFVELGNAHYGLSEFAKAQDDFERALELDSQAPAVIHVKLAKVYVARREFSKAMRELEIYLARDPNGVLGAQAREVIRRMKADGMAPP